MKKKEFPLLDLWRFFAAALVVLRNLRTWQFLPYTETQCDSLPLVKYIFFQLTRIHLRLLCCFLSSAAFLSAVCRLSGSVTGNFRIQNLHNRQD